MTFFDQTLTLIDKIAATPGKNDKIDLLKNHGVADEARLKRVLELCYSPRFRFGISYVEPAKVEVPEFSTYDNAFFPLLEDLNSRKLSGDAAREAVDKFITEASASAGELLRRVIHKDMRAGFSGSTTNKVFAKLIPDHPYMRCLSGEWTLQCEDGETRTIKEIVDGDFTGKVLSRDFLKDCDAWNQIIEKFDNGISDKWVRVEYEENGVRSFTEYMTPTHPVFLSCGREVQVGELNAGDLLF